LALGVGEVLEGSGGGVAGADPDVDAFALLGGKVGKGFDAVDAGEAVDGDGVGSNEVLHVDKLGVAQVRFGVGLSGGADIASFDVADDFEAQLVGLLEQGVVVFDAFPVIAFEKGAIDFDGGHEGGDEAHDLGRELEYGVDGGFEVVFIVEVAAFGDLLGQFLVDGVDSDAYGVAFGLDGLAQTVGKMISHEPSPFQARCFFMRAKVAPVFYV